MIIPVLRRLHSPDAPDLSSYEPPDPDSFALLLQIIVGPGDGEGEESFDAVVCTRRWFSEHRSGDDIVAGLHHIFVTRFDLAQLQRFVESFIKGCAADTWHEVALKLGRLGRWEFDDYRGQNDHSLLD